MFARYFVELEMESVRVTDLLLRDPRSWLPGLATAATHEGDILLAKVGFGHHARIQRQVEIELGEPLVLPSKTVVPLRWTPSDGSGLFPELEADLEVAALEHCRTKLAMSARYAPPFGVFGRVIDRAILSRVADATFKDFLDQVARALMEDRIRVAAGVTGPCG